VKRTIKCRQLGDCAAAGPIVLPNVFRAYDAVLYPTIMIAVVARKRPKNTSIHRESLDPTASICGDAVPPDPSAEPATPREHLYARSLVWTEPGGPRPRCLRAVAWVPGVAGVGLPSPLPVQPQRGVVGLTGLGRNERTKKSHHKTGRTATILAQAQLRLVRLKI